MKKLLKILLVIVVITAIIGSTFYYIEKHYKDEIYVYYQENILKVKDNIKIEKNEYFKNKDYKYVQNTNDFIAKDKKHLLNIFYTVINSGQPSFTFYCDEKYKDCTKDIVDLVNNKETLSNINNFVHPYNSFKKVSTSYDKYGEVKLRIK